MSRVLPRPLDVCTAGGLGGGGAEADAGLEQRIAALEAMVAAFEGCALKRTAKSLCFKRGSDEARIMLIGDGDDVTIGTPTVAGASVSATVIGEALGPKLVIFKFKQKVKYRRRMFTADVPKWRQLADLIRERIDGRAGWW